MVKDRNVERYFVVYATLFDEDVSYRSRWRALQYSVFFPDISLSGNSPWQISFPDDKDFVGKIFLNEFLSF